jgi:hypothetical protein
VNLGAAWLFAGEPKLLRLESASRWLSRLLLATGFGYATAASMIAAAHSWFSRGTESGDVAVVLLFAAISLVMGWIALARRRDVFPLVLMAGSWIAVSTTFFVSLVRSGGLGAFFLISLWLIASSTVASVLLMKWLRAWRIDEDMQEASA